MDQNAHKIGCEASLNDLTQREFKHFVCLLHSHLTEGVYMSGVDIHGLKKLMEFNPFMLSGVMNLEDKRWSFFKIKETSVEKLATCDKNCVDYHQHDAEVVKFYLVKDLPLYCEDKRTPGFFGGQTGPTSIVGPFEASLKTGPTPMTPTTLMTVMLSDSVIPIDQDLTEAQMTKIIKTNVELKEGGQLLVEGHTEANVLYDKAILSEDPDLLALDYQMNDEEITKEGFLRNNVNNKTGPEQPVPVTSCGVEDCVGDEKSLERQRMMEKKMSDLQDQIDDLSLVDEQQRGSTARLQEEVTRYKFNLGILGSDCRQKCRDNNDFLDKIASIISDNKDMLKDIFGTSNDYLTSFNEMIKRIVKNRVELMELIDTKQIIFSIPELTILYF